MMRRLSSNWFILDTGGRTCWVLIDLTSELEIGNSIVASQPVKNEDDIEELLPLVFFSNHLVLDISKMKL